MSLRTKVCVVTGGSSGIGLATARAWAGEQATVVLIARGEERLRQATDDVRAAGGEIHSIVGDVSAAADVDRIAAFVGDLAGRVDILLNNAGTIHQVMPLHELPVAEFDRVWQLNLRGAFLMTRAMVPLLRVRPGAQVINVTSGLKDTAGYGAYSLSKSALDAMTRVMATELAPLGIRVNAFNPGWVRTAMAPEAPNEVATVVPRMVELARQGLVGPTGEEIQV